MSGPPLCQVLIIEDEAFFALDLETLLEREGASSFSFAASQDDAVAAARLQRPDIITSDVNLFHGTGPAAVETIRAALGEIPVVYISATTATCGAEDRVTRTLGKPLDRRAFTAIFREFRQLSCA